MSECIIEIYQKIIYNYYYIDQILHVNTKKESCKELSLQRSPIQFRKCYVFHLFGRTQYILKFRMSGFSTQHAFGSTCVWGMGWSVNFLSMLKKRYRTQPAGVENPGIIMDHFKTQYISLQALPNQLKFTDLRSIFATSWRNKTKT